MYSTRETSLLPKEVKRKLMSPSSVISYAAMAESVGCYGKRIEERDDVIPSLKRGIKEVISGRLVLIEVITSFEVDKISRGGFNIPGGAPA